MSNQPIKNQQFIFYTSLSSQSTGQWQANPTLAAGDVKVATDDGAPANIGTLPVVDADFTKRIKVTLSASEMNGDNVTVIFSDAAGAEWDDMTINVWPLSWLDANDDLTDPRLANLDAAVSSRLATAGYTAPDNATIASIQTDTNDIQTRLPAALTADGNIKADTLRVGGTLQSSGDIIGDTNDIQARLPAALTADGLMKADTLRVGGILQTAGDIIGDTNDIQSRLPAALSGDGFMKADLKSIDDELTTGNNAILNLKQLNINNNGAEAVYIHSDDASAMSVSATTITPGMDFISGIYVATSGSSNNWAIDVFAGNGAVGLEIDTSTGKAVRFVSGSNVGIEILSETGNNDAVQLNASGSGKSINAPNDIAVSDGDLTLTNIAKKVLMLDWTTVTGEAARSVLNALRKLRNRVYRDGTNLKTTEEDDTTVAYTQPIVTDPDQEPFKEVG